jgi:hypothetical protein
MADEQAVQQEAPTDPKVAIVVKGADGAWRMDVDVFVPKPDGYITIGGIAYPIFSFLDIPIAESLKVARLGADIIGEESYDQRLERSIEQVMMLNAQGTPRLTREHFAGLSPRQVITLTVLASSIAQVPLKPVGPQETTPAAGNSPSPSPAPAGSTGGASGSSSA